MKVKVFFLGHFCTILNSMFTETETQKSTSLLMNSDFQEKQTFVSFHQSRFGEDYGSFVTVQLFCLPWFLEHFSSW